MGDKTLLVAQIVILTGLEPAYTAADADGDEFVNSGRAFIHVKNGHADAARTVTIDSQAPCSQGADHDVAVEVAGQAEAMIGPFPRNRFNDAEGKVQISYSDDAADLTVAIIEVP